MSGADGHGDEASCAEAQVLLGAGLTTVAVKRGIGAIGPDDTADPRPPADRGRYEAGADLMAVAAYDPGPPCEIRVEFKNTVAPDKLRFRSGIERVDDRVIRVSADTWWEAWCRYFF